MLRARSGSTEEEQHAVAHVAQQLCGLPFDTGQVIEETLERATLEADCDDQQVIHALREAIDMGALPPESHTAFRRHPLTSWIESPFGGRAECVKWSKPNQRSRSRRPTPLVPTVNTRPRGSDSGPCQTCEHRLASQGVYRRWATR
jgi:hypothetical protein